MIVWTENSACEIALSFKEKAACDELWMKICEVSCVFRKLFVVFCLFVYTNVGETGYISINFN